MTFAFLSPRSTTKIERPPMPCSGLQTIRTCSCRNACMSRHVARDQRRRAALRKPCREHLLVHVAQALRTIHDERALRARRAPGCKSCRCTPCRTADPCASGSRRTRRAARLRLAQLEPVLAGRPAREQGAGARTRRRRAATDRAARRTSSSQPRCCAASIIASVVSLAGLMEPIGIHHDDDSNGHQLSPVGRLTVDGL